MVTVSERPIKKKGHRKGTYDPPVSTLLLDVSRENRPRESPEYDRVTGCGPEIVKQISHRLKKNG